MTALDHHCCDEMFAELDLTVVEGSDISSRSVMESSGISSCGVTDEEPPAWDAATRHALNGSPAVQQLKPAQTSPAFWLEHGSISRPLPQALANGTTMDGHQTDVGGTAVVPDAPAGIQRDEVSRRQRPAVVPPDEREQPEPSLQATPVAVCLPLNCGITCSLLQCLR